ncbi:hypothetical protein [Frankia sp. QA3]|uniref:hypothetical protein n=1 Tax=Frankia sp. QA3 TaxID=710111 RepID=UPI000269BBB9|nr:hypothetical protein [Frankia sp. QA3]EIV91734.1 hypothetical protein FraQA3DRAFT_1204 [Frankia sp. QA3]
MNPGHGPPRALPSRTASRQAVTARSASSRLARPSNLFTLAARPLAALAALGERGLVPLANPDRDGRKAPASETTT